jgi:hypothetical protein
MDGPGKPFLQQNRHDTDLPGCQQYRRHRGIADLEPAAFDKLDS